MDIYGHITEKEWAAEQWRPVPIKGLGDRYEISNLGRVRSIGTGRGMKYGKILKPGWSTVGYLFVVLGSNPAGIRFKNRDIHRLVCIAFNSDTRGKHNVVRHHNDIKWDNRSSNLVWGSQSDNMRDMVRNGRGTQLDDSTCRRILKGLMRGRTVAEAAERFGLAPSVITNLANGCTYQHIDRKSLMRDVGIRSFKLTPLQKGNERNSLDTEDRETRLLKIERDVHRLGVEATLAKYHVSRVMIYKIKQGKYPPLQRLKLKKKAK